MINSPSHAMRSIQIGDELDECRRQHRRLLAALRTARQQIANIPPREEWLGGQRAQYVQVARVLSVIDSVLEDA